jgi:formylglycine-generating enzyme required for sulfatase activity
MPGVLVEMIGSTVTATVTTDSDGYYSFTIEYDGMYDLKFSRKGYSFNKSSLSVDMVGESITAESVDALPVDSEYTDQMVIFKRISAGTFMIGSQKGESDEKPLKNVTISGFWMSSCEISQKVYNAIMNHNPSSFKDDDTLPVEMVNWTDAATFCNTMSKKAGLQPCYDEISWACDFTKDGYRLPTEAEWEYACRAGSTGQYTSGENESDLARVSWYVGNSDYKTHPVGGKEPNAWGLYDMHGNVWEWCNDWYGTYDNTTTNPVQTKKSSYRVIRGGAWSENAAECRSSNRNKYYQGTSFNLIGFRIVRR